MTNNFRYVTDVLTHILYKSMPESKAGRTRQGRILDDDRTCPQDSHNLRLAKGLH